MFVATASYVLDNGPTLYSLVSIHSQKKLSFQHELTSDRSVRVSEDLLPTFHSGILKVATFLASLLVMHISKKCAHLLCCSVLQDVDQCMYHN